MILVTPLQCKILDEIGKHNGISSKNIAESIKGVAISVRVNLGLLQKQNLVAKHGSKHNMTWTLSGLEYQLANKKRPEKCVGKMQITEDMLPKWPVPPSVVVRAQEHYPSYRG